MNGWQLIETAPKETERLLYLARFDGAGLQELDFDGKWDFITEEYPHPGFYGWCSASGIEEPTHWAYQDGPPPPICPECVSLPLEGEIRPVSVPAACRQGTPSGENR